MYNSKKKKEELTFPSLIKRCLVFSGIFFLLTALLVLLLSLIFYNTENPGSIVLFVATASMYLSALISSFALSKFNGGLYLWGGLILGAMVLAVILIASIFIKVENHNIFLQLAIPAITVLGALLGKKREKRNKHKRRFS